MKLLETYAASSGLQISKPFIYTKFFPLPWENFIVLHAGGGMPSKRYDFYVEVVDLLRKHAPEFEIVQIGDNTDPSIAHTVDFRGKTSIHQTAYILQNAKLLIGNDSCNVHIASSLDIPIVALYGPTTIENHGPCFSSPEKLRLLTADLKGNKPSYSAEEYPKTINRIFPEDVAKAALELLGKNPELITRKSLHFGDQYNFPLLEVIPNCLVDANFVPETIPTMRMDYHFDENGLAQNLSIRPYKIITNKPININLLKAYKGRIPQFVYDLPEDYSVEFVSELRRIGINFALTSLLSGDKLDTAKLDMFDYNIIIQRENPGTKFLANNPHITEGCKYKTNKFLLSNSKIYLNKVRWEQDKSTPSLNHREDDLELTKEFLDFAENYYIYRE